MKTAKYTTKTGKQQFKPVLTERELMRKDDESLGFCLACGDEKDGCEPDARKYTCDSCNQPKVYGYSELVMMNLVILNG